VAALASVRIGEEGDDAGVDGMSATEEEGVGEAAPAGSKWGGGQR
jgi:hypothetical protein